MIGSAFIYITSAVVLLGALIFFHELGHFLFAKLLGVKVERFSIGLGPSLWSRKYGETEYILAAIPFGGYIKMLGEDTSLEDMGQDDVEPPTEKDLERAFDRQSVWRRATIILMGPMFNLVLALLIFIGIAAVQGERYLLPIIAKVQAESPAELAGIKPGDRVVTVGETKIENWRQMASEIQKSGTATMDMEVMRDETLLALQVTPKAMVVNSPLGGTETKLVIGITSGGEYFTREIGIVEAVKVGATMTTDVGSLIFKVLVRLVQRVLPADTIGGPLLIFKMAGESAQRGAVDYLFLMALISVNLGMLNLLPIPILDGGHLVFLGFEAVRGKPVSETVMLNAQRVGMALLLMLMVFATYNDIIRFITGDFSP